MTQILFKIGLIAVVMTAITTLIASMPNAEPLPSFIEGVVSWLFSAVYIFNPILHVPAFFECVGYLILAITWYFILLGFIKMIKWVLVIAN